MLQNMGGLTAVEKVFALDELLVPILAYSVTGRDPKNALNIRSVCSKWRSLCFPLLNTQGISANVKLADAKDFTKLVDNLKPNCLLPISLNITKSKLTPEEVKIFLSYSVKYVTVKFDKVYVTGTATDNLDCDLRMLKRLEVRIPSDVGPVHEMIEALDSHSESSPVREMIEALVRRSDSGQLHEMIQALVRNGNNLEEMSADFSDFFSLERTFLQNNLPKLTQLHLMTDTNFEEVEETDVITRIANKFSGQLKVFKVFAREGINDSCKLGKMEFLEELDTYGIHINNTLEDTTPFSELVPNLKSLKIAVFHKFSHYENLLTRNGCRFQNLVKLNITEYLTPTWAFVQGVDFIGRQLRQIDNSIPSLKEFSLGRMFPSVATEALAVVFTRMQRLTKLHIGMAIPDVDMVNLLTGIETSQLPEDRELWREILTGREECITNLTNLNEFSFEVDLRDEDEPVSEIHPFLFQAAFNEMSNLKKLTLTNILVKEELKEIWRDIGRQLDILSVKDAPWD